jgi:flavin-dependent dehydrogenase
VGLAAAIQARLAGLDVVVIEPRQGAIDKACGEGLMPGAVGALDRLGVQPAGHDFAGIAYVSGRLRVEHAFRSGPGRGVRRTVLHEALLRRAGELGVTWIAGKVSGLDNGDAGVTVTGTGFSPIRADWVVGCDGLHSTVRRLAGLAGPEASGEGRRFGIRRHFRVAPWSNLVEVHWTPEVEAYVTPVDAGTVGVALLGPRYLDFSSMLGRVPGLADRLEGADAASAVRGAGPLRQRTKRRTAGRVLLAGDASGYVDALTGEGLRVGFRQAVAAIRSIAAGDARPYEREWMRATRDFRVLTSGLVAAARSPLRSRVVPAAVASPAVFGMIVERLAR